MSTSTTWQLAYANDDVGCPADGFTASDREDLINAVNNGAAVRVGTGDRDEGGYAVFDPSAVWTRTGHLSAEIDPIYSAQSVITSSCGDPAAASRFVAKPNVWRAFYSTTGERSSIVWNPVSQIWGPPHLGHAGCEWFIQQGEAGPPPKERSTWSVVYKHNGARLQAGSIEKLVNAAERGAPTRLVIRQGSRRKGTRRLSTYDAEAVWVNQRPDGWLVSAQVAPLVRADLDNDEGHRELSDPAERTTILVDSDGRYEVLVWRAGDGGTAQHGDATRAVTWLVQS